MQWLNLELTLEQTLYLEQVKRNVKHLNREQLENYLVEVTRQKMIYQNAFKSMVK